jgi:Flp pilus assembly protein TadD
VQGKILFAERLIQAGSYPEAQKMLMDAQRLEPNNPQVHYYQGVVNFSIGDLPAAEKSLNESIRFNKRNPDAHNVLGLVYKQRGDYQRAMSEYQIAIDDPTFAAKESVYLNMGLCLDEMGKTEEAISKLRTAVEINPKYYPRTTSWRSSSTGRIRRARRSRSTKWRPRSTTRTRRGTTASDSPISGTGTSSGRASTSRRSSAASRDRRRR